MSQYLTGNDYVQSQQLFPKLNYSPSNGGNVLHLIAKCTGMFSTYKSRFEDAVNAGLDFNSRDNDNMTPLLVAMKFQNYGMVKSIIDRKLCNINQNYKSKTNPNSYQKNSFSWAAIQSNFDMMKYLIDNGSIYDVVEDISSIKNPDVKVRISRYLLDYKDPNADDILDRESDQSLLKTGEFKMFKFEDFNVEIKIGSGTYGVVNIAVEKRSGIRCVIKRFGGNDPYTYNPNYGLMDQATIHDINTLKMVQRLGHTCSVYGLISHDDNMYMVLEYLKHTLDGYMFLVNSAQFTKEEKEARYMFMIKGMLECIHENSKAGFVHTDVKGANLMIDRNNRVKMIDYGISEYLGLCPFDDIVNSDKYAHSYIGRDGHYGLRTLQERNTGKTITFNGDHISFQKDLPSIPIMIIENMKIGYTFEPFFTKDGQLYKYGINSDYYIKIDDRYFAAKFLNTFSKKMLDLFYAMLEVEPQKRMTAYELLNSHFFGGTGITIERNLELTELPKIPALDKDIIERISNMYESSNSSNYYGRGFPYYDDILKFYSNEKLPAMSDVFNEKTCECILDTFKYLVHEGVNLDAILNYALYLRENKHTFSGTISIPSFDEEHIVSVIAGMFYSDFFDDVALDVQKVVKMSSRIGNVEVGHRHDAVIKYAKHFYTDPRAYNIRPFMIFIGYIKFILQCVCANPHRINKLICHTIYKVVRYVLLIHCSNGKGCTGFDLVAACYCSIPEHIDINVEPSDKDMISCVDDVSRIPPHILNNFDLMKNDWYASI